MKELIPTGWNVLGNGIAANNDPILGGIIDKEIVSGKWFVIFNDDEIPMVTDLDSREDAFRVFREKINEKYILD